MSAERQAVTVRDLVGEAKKRIVFLIVSVVGLSYLMSLTSSSVLFNFPAAAFLIIILRYLSLDFDMRRKAATYKNKPTPAKTSFQTKYFEVPHDTKGRSDWKMKVNSPVVEDAIDQFTRHLVSEWVTDLWYSRITPDRQAPEELVHVINSVLAEVSCRARNINLIDLLTRDIINLICSHLELFRASQTKIERQKLTALTSELRDIKLKSVLAAENKLHPALFSAEAEHKVLQHLVDGLITFTFRPKDLQCSLFRYIVRELLACAVIRPVLNLVSPRFINERIESAVISSRKSDKGGSTEEEASQSKPNGSSKNSSDSFSPFLDPSVKGVELVQFKKDESRNAAKKPPTDDGNGNLLSKDPLLATDARSTCSWGSFPSGSQVTDGKKIPQQPSGGEWGEMLALISRRKTEALAPEHFENMWTKGRNYKRKEGVPGTSSIISQSSSPRISETPRHRGKNGAGNGGSSATRAFISGCSEQAVNSILNESNHPALMSYEEDDGLNHMDSDKVESGTTSSKETEDEESSTVTGLHSPGIKVWDGKSNRNYFVSHIRHPLEVSEGHKTKKMGKGHAHSKKLPRTQSGRKRSRLSDQKLQIWQEIDRTSFLSGDGQDILKSSKGNVKSEDLSDDSETEMLGRIHSGSTASSSMSSISLAESHILAANTPKSLLLTDSYLKLRCEVMGANIVKSGSKIFAVYSISVMDVNGNCWSIKRRFRHFEELHRRLKEFPEYNLHLPPKHFLSTGLDVPVIRERCTLLDRYLKNLLQLPTISGSIEVWDFLSVDSQTYVFSNSLSIIETLSVDLGDTSCEKSREVENINGPVAESFSSWRGHENSRYMDYAPQTKFDFMADGPRLNLKNIAVYPPRKPAKEFGKQFEDSGSDSDSMVHKHISSTQNSGKINVEEGDGLHEASESLLDTPTDPILPTEWVPPSLSVPILDLVDVIFQLQDGGWIRRKSFWVAKQVLQLGMGDAFDDWLIEKIQLLHRGSVIASGIRRVEQILWPDGIFITKHPKRQQPASSVSPSHNSSHDKLPTLMSSPKRQDINEEEEMRQKEAERRAKFVYELMIDNVPAAIVGLVGRKEYEQCVKDLYYFLQSSVGLKQLAFELLELLLLSAIPEMDYIFKELHEEKARFGECKVS